MVEILIGREHPFENPDKDFDDFGDNISLTGTIPYSDAESLPTDYQTAVEKTINDVEMLIHDEIVAARRLQTVINSDILTFVTDHIRKNDPNRVDRMIPDDAREDAKSTFSYLQCKFKYFPLRFVNFENNYEGKGLFIFRYITLPGESGRSLSNC